MFGRLFAGNKKGTEIFFPPPLTDALRQTVLGSLGLRSIPAMPQAAQKAFELATNPNAEAQDYVEVIEADEAISARILKVANSVFYDRGHGSKTIADAVHVIGTTELRGLLNATALADLFTIKHPLRNQLWGHDIATALTAKLLARRLLPSQTDQAFLAGLMHDVGKLLMLQRHTDTYEKIVQRSCYQHLSSIEAEEEEYPFDHTQVGQLIAERWNFTEDLTTVIRCHHERWEALPSLSLVSLVKGADILTNALGLGLSREWSGLRSVYEPLVDSAWEALGISAPDRRPLSEEIKRAFETEYEIYASWGSG